MSVFSDIIDGVKDFATVGAKIFETVAPGIAAIQGNQQVTVATRGPESLAMAAPVRTVLPAPSPTGSAPAAKRAGFFGLSNNMLLIFGAVAVGAVFLLRR